MSKTLIPLLLAGILLAGSFTSCKKHITDPPDDTSHHCDTCCDTCKKDTNTKPPCDTCNIDKDSAAHAFTWTEYIDKIPGEANLTGVWVFGPNDIMICGNSLWHFDGVNFTLIHCIRNGINPVSMDGALNGNSIFAFSKTDFWLVSGSIAYHTKDGQHFDDFRPGSSNACWGPASNDVYVVGNGGQIHHFDGTSFAQMTSNTTKGIRKIWGTSDNNIWACGSNQSTGESVLLNYNGLTWTEQDLSKLGEIGVGKHALIGVWTCDSNSHHITVASGSFVYRTIDNSLWRSDTLKNALGGGSYAGINNVRGNSATDFMVQGSGGFVSHWNGKTWFFYQQLFNWSDPSYDINAFSFTGNTACMVGYKDGQGYMAVGTRK